VPGTVITERVREKFKCFSETGRVFFMGAAFTKRIAAEIYHYFEEAVYHRLDMPTRRFLLDLSPFERFDTELAKMVTGSKDAGETLSSLIENSNMMVADRRADFTSGKFSETSSSGRTNEPDRTRNGARS
jgi:hypothetical protein